jgi:hypothetical protein
MLLPRRRALNRAAERDLWRPARLACRGESLKRRGTHRKVFIASILAAAASILLAPGIANAASTGFAVQPADGSTVSTGNPTFLVYIDDGDTIPQVEVSTAPDHNDFGFTGGYTGSCTPTTPFGEPHKFTCQLPPFEVPLAPGTYYWAYTFDKNVCQTSFGYTSCYPQAQFSGPFKFTVAQPVPPAGAGLISPADGALVGTAPTLTVHAPAGSSLQFYASDSSVRLSDGTPAGTTVFSCSGSADTDSDYTCSPNDAYQVQPGATYYWWAVITVDGAAWIYGPRSFTVRTPPSGGGGGGGGGGSGGQTHTIADAPYLPSSAHFTGRSVKQTRLSQASYALSKVVGVPKTIAVACWSATDWPGISGDSGDGIFTTLGLYYPRMPHWISLSPTVCRGLETLLYHRPTYPNRIIASDVDTATHEMVHAMGVIDEARTECYAMQLSIIMAFELHVPFAYGARLARLTLANYFTHPARYIDPLRCREDGAWDLFPHRPSPPWHDLGGL